VGAEAGLVFFVVVVAMAFYWILLRPVMAQQRRQRSDIQSLEVGDEVLTQAGFIARVKDIRVPPEGPTEIVLELGPGLEVRAYATAIVQKLWLGVPYSLILSGIRGGRRPFTLGAGCASMAFVPMDSSR
jgi:preprotein translocase YajC subunit